MPSVSVITAVFNGARLLEHTIRSVLNQSYDRLEYLVVDGGSRDGTVELLCQFGSRLKWISEPDNGIYDAFNKGIQLATGQYILFVSAGDWLEPDHVRTAVQILERDQAAAFVYGDVAMYKDNQITYVSKGCAEYSKSFRYGMGVLNHPSMVVRRALFDSVGVFDTSYKVSGDFNWLQRVHQDGNKGTYTDKLRANMILGGVSDRLRLLALKENRISSIAVGMNEAACWTMYIALVSRYLVRRFIERFVSGSFVWFIRKQILRSHLRPN